MSEESEDFFGALAAEDEPEDAAIASQFPFAKVMDPRDPDGTRMRVIVKTKDDFEDTRKLILSSAQKYFNPYTQNRDLRSKTKSKFAGSSKVKALLSQNDAWQQKQTRRMLDEGNPKIQERYQTQERLFMANATKSRGLQQTAEAKVFQQMEEEKAATYKKWILPDL